ncbi:MAG TPA: cbb3-type cytochrome oxidase assembly protein CcoS [Acetobacteraceae bacterium]|jgi:cbb3-type cytochrome oxidase maturation protein|nr:cbb3-type cytochrome oxidase assembly protein CcoS [Acetobacteraceae bacterium]
MTMGLYLLGTTGLALFPWSLPAGRYDDIDGAASRVLFDDEPGRKARDQPSPRGSCCSSR